MIIRILFIIFYLSSFYSCISNSRKDSLRVADTQISTEIIINKLDNEVSNFNHLNNSKSLKVLSWNIRDLGRSKNKKELQQIATIINDYDLIAIQEVVAKDPSGARAIAKINDELNRMGHKWDYRVSDPTRSPSAYISERYAFLWKTSVVKMTNRAYLDKTMEDICLREPFIGKFQLTNDTLPFYLINFHSRKYYDKPELEIFFFIEYPEKLKTDRLIILGDFNLDENHKVWNDFYDAGFNSALKNVNTTLKRKCKNDVYLNHAIDNLYFPTSNIHLINSGSVDFVGNCDNLDYARGLSDHLPVFMEMSIN